MRILEVASCNNGCVAPFIREQASALESVGCEIGWYGVRGNGIWGYLKNFSALKKQILSFHPDVVHAHYGLCGLLACFQRKVPTVVTYHGSDINDGNVLQLSRCAMRLSSWNVFVSKRTMEIAKPKKNYSLVPCGVDIVDLQMTERNSARNRLKLSTEKKYVLFAGSFGNAVKNAPLAKETVARLNDNNVELLELKGYTRDEVTLMMCASNVLLMTSFSEGSPQVVKEAMVCGCPIVSVDVGDVKERTEGIDGCYVAKTREVQELVELLQMALAFEGRTKGRKKAVEDGLDNRKVAETLLSIYSHL